MYATSFLLYIKPHGTLLESMEASPSRWFGLDRLKVTIAPLLSASARKERPRTQMTTKITAGKT